MTAKVAAEGGLSVLLLERELEVGIPNKCGEFLPSLSEMKRLAPKVHDLDEIFDPPSNCIVNRTENVKFVFPNNHEISIPFNGLVVERKLYDKYLANEAARAGAEISTHTKVVDLLDRGQGVRARNVDGLINLHSRVVVAADGAYSLVARKSGLSVSRNPLDYGVGYQYEMVNVEHDSTFVEMYLGEDIAPGTYAWIIPKGDDVANVGTGVRSPYMKKNLGLRDYLHNFMNKHPMSSEKLLKAVPTAIKAGCIPVGGPLSKTYTDNVIAVGDAGGHTIPTVGGGIPPALICGRIAGQVIVEYLIKDLPLSNFQHQWKNQLGKTLENALRLRKMSDIVFNNEKIIDIVTKKGWLNNENIEKFVLCEIDIKMKLIEKTLTLFQKK
jgi:digeranylgeranylglycerophospholipid reductase